LVCAEVVDVEDELFRKELGGPPDDPADARVDLLLLNLEGRVGRETDESVFVA
jgi:hypothetical protein